MSETPSIKKRPSAHWDHVEQVAERQAETPRADVENERTVRSLAAMLGWENTPPRETLERSLSALRSRWQEAEVARQETEADLENALARERGLLAELSSLRSQVETLRKHARHTPDCELEWPVARRQKSPEFGRYLMKRVNGKIAHGWDHQCGAAGFGLGADDVCYGCDRESEEREPDCTCGLSAALGKDSQ